MTEKFNVRDALSTNKLALDYEWLRQAHLLKQATDILADVTFKRDMAKSKLAYESSKLANWIRSNPDAYNINGTPTDNKVKEIVITEDEIQERERLLYEWEAEVIAANGVRRALEHKKTALEELTRLFLSGYWATPYVSTEDREKYRESTNDNQSEALSRNVRLKERAQQKDENNGEE